ncbi:MAG: M28 family peptidase [Bacteroidota bacterium]
MKKITILFGCICICLLQVEAQDIEYAKRVVKDLCSPEMAGRGYVKKGMQKAADYIHNEYKQTGLVSFGVDYFQPLGYQAIAFPNRVEVSIDDKEMIAGEDFIVSPGCPNITGAFDIVIIDSATIDNPAAFKTFEKTAFYKTFLVVDGLKGKKLLNTEAATKILSNGYKAKGLIYANQEKLTWSVALEWEKFPTLYFLKGAIQQLPYRIKLLIESEANDYAVNNVIGYVKGTQYPDSFLVLSAHYDHLGMLGHYAMFPGANDNASGVAMMLDLMKNIKKNPLPYSVAFMAFAGEEAGLIGSVYYTQIPLFPLSQISMLINLDLMGTGDKGMTVVNATVFPNEFQQIQLLNLNKDYLPVVNARGKAANSDHYYFTEKGVKSFFFYLMGEYKYYHDINDGPEALTFSKYNEAFSLIHDFMTEYSIQYSK